MRSQLIFLPALAMVALTIAVWLRMYARRIGEMKREDAIRALTMNAAEILGIADRVGSLEAGKDANLFISTGDPLEIRSRVTHVVIKGQDVGLANKHLALYDKYIARQ